MKTMIRTTFMAALILGMATAFAKEEYKKEDDSSIVLTIDNGVATITKAGLKKIEVLAQGRISYDTNSDDPSSQDFLISQEEGVVCPPQIWAQTITDIVKGASRSAIKIETLYTGSAHRHCKNLGLIDGIYEFSK